MANILKKKKKEKKEEIRLFIIIKIEQNMVINILECKEKNNIELKGEVFTRYLNAALMVSLIKVNSG